MTDESHRHPCPSAMWKSVDIEAMIDHPPERVFPYLADPIRWHEFAPAVASRRRIDGGQARIGSRWAAIDRIGPFRIHFTDELLELEHDRRVVWTSTAPWNSRVEYVCVPEPGGTRVLARYEGDVAGWLRLLALLPTFALEMILQRDFTGLQKRLAADAEGGGAGRGSQRSRSLPDARVAWAAARRATGTRNGEHDT